MHASMYFLSVIVGGKTTVVRQYCSFYSNSQLVPVVQIDASTMSLSTPKNNTARQAGLGYA
jgi:hypothetical protein